MTPPPVTRREFIHASAASAGTLLSAALVPVALESQGGVPQATRRATKAPVNVIPLPKSGGAVAGIGETFTPDLFTGTETIAVPLPLSANRDGFDPALRLTYSVSHGNGPFGMGWRLDQLEVVRRTETRLPTYDALDRFLLGGDTELRPNVEIATRRFQTYTVIGYRPRHESAFSRIEHWVRDPGVPAPAGSSASFWRVTTKDNVTSLLGATQQAVVADPLDPASVFRWALEIAYDGKGNFIHYAYKQEDGEGAPATERELRVAQTYLKRVRYGNLQPVHFPDPLAAVGYLTTDRTLRDCFFEAVFDYGEHGTSDQGDRVIDTGIYRESRPWTSRPDAFSSCRARFEVRTRRLCTRVLMFHRMAGELVPTLVRSLECRYERAPDGDCARLSSLTSRGYARSRDGGWKYSEEFEPRRGIGVRSLAYDVASIPPLELTYSTLESPRAEDLVTLTMTGPERPRQLADGNTALVDLFHRGVPDILETGYRRYLYWKNLGRGRFAPRSELRHAPSGVMLESPEVAFTEMTGDGRADLLVAQGDRIGYCRALDGTSDASAGWDERPAFFAGPAPFLIWDRNLRFLDLTGTGSLDALKTESNRFVWFENLGPRGFVRRGEIPRNRDLAAFPDISFADERVHLADMNGDGLLDIVLFDPGQGAIHYWPNLGFGRFGRRVIMSGTPRATALFERMFFADIDGNGLADLVYVASGVVEVWMNASGAGWTHGWRLTRLPSFPADNPPEPVDLFGDGMTGLLWSGASAGDYKYLRLTRNKPFLLCGVTNNRGNRIRYEYKPSTAFALEISSRADDAQWRLPFPVHVLCRVERIDDISETSLVSTFVYDHGYFDGEDRAFRGFGRVDQLDAEHAPRRDELGAATRAADFHQPPVLTKTWFHTGRHDPREFDTRQETAPPLADEYYRGDPRAHRLGGNVFPAGLPASVQGEAARSLAGRRLRQEVYALDASTPGVPYTVSEFIYRVRQLQGGDNPAQTAFFAHADQELGVVYERTPSDPRVTHGFTLSVDAYGHVTESASVTYPRRTAHAPEQARALATYTVTSYAARTQEPGGFRHGVVVDEQTYELIDPSIDAATRITSRRVRDWKAAAAPLQPGDDPRPGSRHARLVARTRHHYWKDDCSTVLPQGDAGLRALPHTTWRQAFTPGLLERVYGSRVDEALAAEGGYQRDEDGCWWIPNGDPAPDRGAVRFDAAHFCLPVQWNDALGRSSTAFYDANWLVPTETRDALENVTKAVLDYRTLLPSEIQDVNGNRTSYAFDALGRIAGTAVAGKAGEQIGDTLAGFQANLDYRTIRACLDRPLLAGQPLLAGATSRIVYDAWGHYKAMRSSPRAAATPAAVCTMTRETHVSDLGAREQPRVRHSFVYYDGFGRTLQSKVRAAPDAAGARWVGSGATVYDNKGNPIKQYEPFFSRTHQYESDSVLTRSGVTPVLRYDPLGRLIRTDKPDGTLTRVTIGAWRREQWDEMDTVLEGTWYRPRSSSPNPTDNRAAELSRRHAATPAIVHADGSQRSVESVADNGPRGQYSTRTAFDIQGNVLRVTDARGTVCLVSDYDMLGRAIRTQSVDSGDRVILPNSSDAPMREWDGAGHTVRREYDALDRLTHVFVRREPDEESLVQQHLYGERVPGAAALGLRGELYRTQTEATVFTNERFDFKRNVIRSTQSIGTSPGAAVLTRITSYDALNRPLSVTHPDGSVTLSTYDEGGRIRTVGVRLTPASPLRPHVLNVEYNARGQRRRLEYGNGVRVDYTYDDKTFRLLRLVATRRDNSRLQDVSYTYDAAGNVVEAVDDARDVVFSSNLRVEPRWRFEYDALYRLTAAEGREHRCIGASPPARRSSVPGSTSVPPHPNDEGALTNYREEYGYDEVGNLRTLRHRSGSGGWALDYAYSAGTNRLAACGTAERMETYAHDANGNMTTMSQSGIVEWDHAGRMKVYREGETRAVYGYDATGARVRKTVARGGVSDDRVYASGFERFERRRAGNLELARQTTHTMLGQLRVSSVESVAIQHGQEAGTAPRTRFTLHDHLESIRFELDEDGAVVSYEEFRPFGASACRVGRSVQEVSERRYRYLGKELDEESGLYYFGARYYAPWLGRWISCDPLGIGDGPNPYVYVGNNPVRFVDPQGLTRQDTAMTYEEARQHANEQNKTFRAAQGMKGSEVQSGHTAAPRHAPESGITKAQMDEAPFMQLHSRKGQGLDATVTDPVTGKTSVTTRHRAQEGMIDDGVERARAGNEQLTGERKLTAQGHLDNAREVEWRAQGTGLDQREVRDKLAGGLFDERAAIEKSPAVQAYRAEQAAARGVERAAAKVAGEGAGTVSKLIAGVGEAVATKGGRLVPAVGTGLGVAEGLEKLSKGDYAGGIVELIGASEVPVLSQTADYGSLAAEVMWVVKEVVDPGQRIEQWWYQRMLK